MNTAREFFKQGISVVKVTNWLDWAIGNETDGEKWAIVLPMIQRGSVWKPHQGIDLWDTILRGMPFGGLMASHIRASTESSKVQFFSPLDRILKPLPEGGGLSLIDGQQRTLAMLIAWPDVGTQINRRLWIDFGEDDKFDHFLRFHLTTTSHPFGYQRGTNSGEIITRLSLSDRRRASATYADTRAVEKVSVNKPDFLHDEEITPWFSTLALDLRLLIKQHHNDESALRGYIYHQKDKAQKNLAERIQRLEEKQRPFEKYDEPLRTGIINHLRKRLNEITEIKDVVLDARIEKLKKGLERLSSQYFPVIEVPSHLMDEEEKSDSQDPPLAVLFKRIGTGGTKLETADYVFSVIKHRNPDCHSLVETQLQNGQIAAIFTPTALVMSAVRLTAAKLGRTDAAKLEKQQFTRLLRGEKKDQQAASDSIPFLTEFSEQIAANGNFVINLQAILKAIAYQSPATNDTQSRSLDIGLPKYALCLVQIPALEVVLFWLQKQAGEKRDAAQKNRGRLIRFILCWHLTVLDTPKASMECFKVLAGQLNAMDFPENNLLEKLVTDRLALPMRSPDELKEIATKPIRISKDGKDSLQPAYLTQSNDVPGLRGWKRFVADVDDDGLTETERTYRQQAVKLYERWWNLRGGYSHALLLWLQRGYVYRRFEENPAQPGMEDDTPYDFDHICPANHWHGWSGIAKNHRLIDFPADTTDQDGNWRLGNAIGNVRVWDSSDNRSDGDAAPSIKLMLIPISETNKIADHSDSLLSDSAIATDSIDDWISCSPADTDGVRHWKLSRAISFQKAIELRTFNLYQRFYDDLKFGKQLQSDSATQ